MIPALGGLDSTAAVLADGYLFGTRRFARVDADAFRTRILGRPVVVARGIEAARFFYEGGRFDRAGALPGSVLHLLQDEGSVQTLEDEQHHRRKRLFLSLVETADERSRLVSAFALEWQRSAARFAGTPVPLQDVAAEVLGRAVLAWAGIALGEEEAQQRSDELRSMVDNAGRFGPPNWAARLRRRRTEHWAQSLIEASRAAGLPPEEGAASIVDRIAHAEEDGAVLPTEVAAVELLNLLRPTVAVGRFIVFAALALHDHPEWRDRLEQPEERAAFANEVRRFYPFFPLVGGRARTGLPFQGETLPAGQWFLLDLYATDHAVAHWDAPETFDPSRFLAPVDRNGFIAQGGGHYGDGHRCPGEPATVDLLAEALELLTTGHPYDVAPGQDFSISLRSFPTEPADGFVVTFRA
ncbi:cytochrome P450 [Rathayibacter caricis DSM 15933]|uniref:Cytochrome P450 n=1 Tax=Rathayibacter caricis DSM 15933 TaxID=1328867 RepID=A0A2T4UQV2_9MICO|nr:cytochrome P450 [Rathayibacter caricis]PTL71897.1 cytochrome P450 [Rathayibacter caricis DSM 15933]